MTNHVQPNTAVAAEPTRLVLRAVSCSLLAALPLAGLILFFEITTPASTPAEGYVSRQLRVAFGGGPGDAAAAGKQASVARIEGVSAEVRDIKKPDIQSATLTALAGQAFSDARQKTLRVGLRLQFTAPDGHKFALRIIRRDAISDEPMPDNQRMAEIAPASTADVVSFIWGQWRYSVEIQDLDPRPEIVVQKSL